MTDSALNQAIELYHLALTELIKGNPTLQKERFSRREDVTLLNPFDPFVQGREHVQAALDQVASLYIEAEPKEFERLVTHVTADLAFIVEIERARVLIRGRQKAAQLALRVTTIFRPEEGTWKVVHRHADTITTPQRLESVIQQGDETSEDAAQGT